MNKTGIKITVLVIVLLALVAIGATYYLRPQPNLPKPIKIDTSDQPMLGKMSAKVHIIVFEDLKCHNCARFNMTLLPKIKKEYIDPGVAKYTMINLAFINGSMPAANAARCLYFQNKKFFFPFVKYVYFHQPSETQNWATLPNLIQFAKNIKGVDTQKLSQCIYKSPYTNFISGNLKIAVKAMGDTIATPTLFVNGMIVKPLTLERFKTIVKAAKKQDRGSRIDIKKFKS